MNDIRTKPATKAYRDHYDRIFRRLFTKPFKMTPIYGDNIICPYPDLRKVKFDSKNYGVVAIKTKRGKHGKNQRKIK